MGPNRDDDRDCGELLDRVAERFRDRFPDVSMTRCYQAVEELLQMVREAGYDIRPRHERIL